MRRAWLVLAGLGAAALMVPATAAADVNVSLQGGTLTITASEDDDDVSLAPAGSNALGPTTRVSGGGQDMVAGPGCQGFGEPNGPANDNSVFCPTNDILRLQVDLLGGDDEFSTEGFEAVVNAGAGEDEITLGRTGSDGVNTIDGGPDDDTIDAGRAGEGDDIAGGSGTDTVTYASHGGRDRDPGRCEQRRDRRRQDNVRPDVEKVVGTGGDDSLTGSGGDDTLDGPGGRTAWRGSAAPTRWSAASGRTTPPSAERATTRSCSATGWSTRVRAAAPAATPWTWI